MTSPMSVTVDGCRLTMRCLHCGAEVTVAHLRSTSALLFSARHKHGGKV